jgi:MFS family permease
MSMAGEPAHLRVQTKSRAASVVSAPHKDSRAPALPEWSIILSSAAIMGLDLFLFAALWNTFRADSVDDVTGEFFLLLSIAWVIHGLTTEALLHGSHYITRHRENKLAWFIKTALMGMAANGLLLRRSSLPIGWGQVLIVAAGWVAAFFLGGTLVEFIMETVIRNPDWATLNSSNVSYPGIFFVGLVLGALGGLVTLRAAKWNQRRQRLRSSA